MAHRALPSKQMKAGPGVWEPESKRWNARLAPGSPRTCGTKSTPRKHDYRMGQTPMGQRGEGSRAPGSNDPGARLPLLSRPWSPWAALHLYSKPPFPAGARQLLTRLQAGHVSSHPPLQFWGS